MADPEPADAAPSTEVTAIANAPAQMLNALRQGIAQAQTNAAHNAVTQQQNAQTVLQAATTQGVALLYGLDTAAIAASFFKKPISIKES